MKKPAMGTKGTLIFSMGELYFRVYSSRFDEGFKDYEIFHNDLEVIISDVDAQFDDDIETLDYSDETLGRRR